MPSSVFLPGLDVPRANASRSPESGQVSLGREHRVTVGLKPALVGLVAAELRELLARVGLEDTRDPVLPERRYPCPVLAERAAVALEDGEVLAAVDVPQAHRRIVAPREQPSASGLEGHAPHLSLTCLQGTQIGSARRLDEPDGAVARRRGQNVARVAEGHVGDGRVMGAQRLAHMRLDERVSQRVARLRRLVLLLGLQPEQEAELGIHGELRSRCGGELA